MEPIVRSFFRLLIACSCGFTLCQIGQAQDPTAFATIQKQIETLEKQQRLILNKLNELEGRLPANGTGAKLPTTTEVRGEDFMGSADARIAVIEYGDYECEFCEKFESDSFSSILANYIQTGKIKFFYRDLPLHHPHAMLAAQAAHCAGDQGKYWQMHDALFQNQTDLSEKHISEIAGSLGLDALKFADCLASDKFKEDIEASVLQASKLGMSATPEFITGTLENGGKTVRIDKRIVGALPYDMFKADLDELLASPRPKR